MRNIVRLEDREVPFEKLSGWHKVNITMPKLSSNFAPPKVGALARDLMVYHKMVSVLDIARYKDMEEREAQRREAELARYRAKWARQKSQAL